ncbi:MAG TPA: LPS-assembly lipoprotein LptE [Xylella taiwanensis]
MIKFLTTLAAAALITGLTGCDFHLRNKLNLPPNPHQPPNLNLPPNVPALLIQSSIKYSELEKLLRRGLHASGVTVVEDPTTSGVAQLKILSERWGDLPIAIDSQGRGQEYSLRYAAIFTLVADNGEVVVPQQVIELSRDYLSPPVDATGTTTEREILANELRRDMSASILRRIDSVVRSRLEKSELLEQAKPPSSAASGA